jgi:hypothetical protein
MIGPVHVGSLVVGIALAIALNYFFNFPSRKG